MPTYGLHPPASPTSSSSCSCQSGACRQPSTSPPASGGDCIKYQCHRAVPLLPTPPHLYFGPGLTSPHHVALPHARVIPLSKQLSGCLDCIPSPDLLTYGTSIRTDMAVSTIPMRPFNLTSSSSPFGPVFPPPNSSLGGFASPFSSSPPLSLSSLMPPLPPVNFQDQYPTQCPPMESTSPEAVSLLGYPFSCSSPLSDGFGLLQDAPQQETSSSPVVLSSWEHSSQIQSGRQNSASVPSAIADCRPSAQYLAECSAPVVSMESSFSHQAYLGPQCPVPLSSPPGSHHADSAVPQGADEFRSSGHLRFPSQVPWASFPDVKHQGGGTFLCGKANLGHLKELHDEEANINWSLQDRLWIGSEYAKSYMSPEEHRWERHQKLRGYSKLQANAQMLDSSNLQCHSTGSNVQAGLQLPGQCAAYSEDDVKKGEISVPVSVGHHTPSLKWAASAFAEMLATVNDSASEQTTPLALDFGGSEARPGPFCSNLGYLPPSVYRVSSFGGLPYYKLNGEPDDPNWVSESSHYGTACDQLGSCAGDPLELAPYKWPEKNVVGACPSSVTSARTKKSEPSVPKRSKVWYAKDIRKSLLVTGKSISGIKGATEIPTDAEVCENVPVPVELSDADKVTVASSPVCAAHSDGEDSRPSCVNFKSVPETIRDETYPQGRPQKNSSAGQSSRGYVDHDSGGWYGHSAAPHVLSAGHIDDVCTGKTASIHAGVAGLPSLASVPSPSETPSPGAEIVELDSSSQSTVETACHDLDIHNASSKLCYEETPTKDGLYNDRVWSLGHQTGVAAADGPSSVVHGWGSSTGIPVVLSQFGNYGESFAKNEPYLHEPSVQTVHQAQAAKPTHVTFPSWLPSTVVSCGRSSSVAQCNNADSTASTASVVSSLRELKMKEVDTSEYPGAAGAFISGGQATAAINQEASEEETVTANSRFGPLTKSLQTLTSVLLACLSSPLNPLMATELDALQSSVHNISECLLFKVSAKGNCVSPLDATLKGHQARSSFSSVLRTGTATHFDGKVKPMQEAGNLQNHTQDRAKVPIGEFLAEAGNDTRPERQFMNIRTSTNCDMESLQVELRAKEAEIARLKFQGLKNAILKVRTREEKVAEVEKLRRAEVVIENLRDELEVEREENKGAMHLYKVMLNEAKEGAAHALREADRIKLELAALKAKMAQDSPAGKVESAEEYKAVQARVAVIRGRQECISGGNGGMAPSCDTDKSKSCFEYPGFFAGSIRANDYCDVSHFQAEAKSKDNSNDDDSERRMVEMRAALIKARHGLKEIDKGNEPPDNGEEGQADMPASADQQGVHACPSSCTHLTGEDRSGGLNGNEVASKLLEASTLDEDSDSVTNVSVNESLEVETGWEHV